MAGHPVYEVHACGRQMHGTQLHQAFLAFCCQVMQSIQESVSVPSSVKSMGLPMPIEICETWELTVRAIFGVIHYAAALQIAS